MKRIFCLAIALIIILPLCFIGISAEETPALNKTRPDWLITEIAPNTEGSASSPYGYTNGRDVFEALEVYNNSDKTLSLYDYCLTYNGNQTTHASFETQIVEITPFLTNNEWKDEPGNYLDGSTLTSTNMPTNPQTCDVAPGECVVIWVMYCEAYYDEYSPDDGVSGVSIENFRHFWNIPENVKVIACDGNSSVDGTWASTKLNNPSIPNGGHDKNFNLKNSKTGTYGIALYSEALNTAANTTVGSSNVFECTNGYTECEDLITWATVDFLGPISTLFANNTIEFTYDNEGKGAERYSLTYSSKRMQFSEANCLPTFGSLSAMQKMTIPYYEFTANEKVIMPTIYDVEKGYQFDGWTVDDGTTVYAASEEVTLDAGKHTFTPVFSLKPITTTEAPVETDPVTTAPETTAAPVTAAPTTNAPETTAPEKKGCGKSGVIIGIAQIILAIGGTGAFIIFKKK